MLTRMNLGDRVKVQLSTKGIAMVWHHRRELSVEERNAIVAEGYVWTTTLAQLFTVFGASMQGETPFVGGWVQFVEPGVVPEATQTVDELMETYGSKGSGEKA